MTVAGTARPLSPRTSGRQDFGDFQTPPALVAKILARLGFDGNIYDRVFEPTCGRGHFLAGVLAGPCPPREVRGVEIQADHAEAARSLVGNRGRILQADLFQLDLNHNLDWSGEGRLLVVGNPPWVTVAALGASGGLASNPGPARINSRRVSGLDAMTGTSNFDLAEAIWIKLIRELASDRPTIALLCKTSVARSLLRAVKTDGLPIRSATLWKIDAGRWFHAAVSAGLLRIEVGSSAEVTEVPVFADLDATITESTWGLTDGSIVADLPAYRRASYADGAGPIAWRQGVKHDATAVMELIPTPGGGWQNGYGAVVDVEPERIYPWFKATDLARGTSPEPRRSVVISQRSLREDPGDLAQSHPRLWAYLKDTQSTSVGGSRQSIGAGPRFPCSGLAHTRSARSRWEFRGSTSPSAFELWGRSTDVPRWWTTPRIFCLARRPRRLARSRPYSTVRPRATCWRG